jgi:hypothetical protein
MDTNRFSTLASDVTEIPGTSQVSETQPQPTVVGFQNTTPEDFANDINMGDSTAGSTRPTTPTNAHKRPRPAETPPLPRAKPARKSLRACFRLIPNPSIKGTSTLEEKSSMILNETGPTTK